MSARCVFEIDNLINCTNFVLNISIEWNEAKLKSERHEKV